MSKDFLRNLPLFAELTDKDLNWLCEQAEPVTVAAGEFLMKEGTIGDAIFVVVDGMFEITKRAGQQEVVIAGCETGEVLGEISLLQQAPRTASVRALRESHVLRIGEDAFQSLLDRSPQAAQHVLRLVLPRLRNTEAMLMQQEKLASLGSLAAGLAHELNNPAAAVRRSVDQLQDAVVDLQARTLDLHAAGLTDEKLARVNQLREESRKWIASPIELDPLAGADRESELQDWLEECGIEEAWQLAPALVELGLDLESMHQLDSDFEPAELAAVLRWLGANGVVYSLLADASMSAERISEIVTAVKAYSYLDRGPVQQVDIHQGLENTLVILRHKLKAGVEVRREYDPDLPRIEGYGGELNQVWTNIIDNAIDAMNGQGVLTLRTWHEDGRVIVEVSDSGPGIPPDVMERLFDPFFTTKGQGVGSGLGLHISRNIIVVRHAGDIRVNSEPGQTTFKVTLPVELPHEI